MPTNPARRRQVERIEEAAAVLRDIVDGLHNWCKTFGSYQHVQDRQRVNYLERLAKRGGKK